MRILFFGLFLIASATAWTQHILPIEHHQGDLVLRIGPNVHEAWIGQSPQHTFEFTRQGFKPTHYLDMKWTDVRKMHRVYETNLNDTNNNPCLCIESLNRWVIFTERFDVHGLGLTCGINRVEPFGNLASFSYVCPP